MGDEVGLMPGDKLIRVGDIDVNGPQFGLDYRRRYAREPAGTAIPIIVERAGQRSTCRARSGWRPVSSGTSSFFPT
jgi:hypothetical protein